MKAEYIVRVYENFQPVKDRCSPSAWGPLIITEPDGGSFFSSFRDIELLKLELAILRYKYPESIFKIYKRVVTEEIVDL